MFEKQIMLSSSFCSFFSLLSLSLNFFCLQFLYVLQESVDALMKCVTSELGFSEGKPVAAITIYKCLLHWRLFEAEKTSVFDRFIQIIGSEIEVN